MSTLWSRGDGISKGLFLREPCLFLCSLEKQPILRRQEKDTDVTAEKKESKLQKALDAASKLIAKLKAEIDSLKQEISDYKSVHSKLRAAELERENTELRGKVRSYEDVIQRNNLWRFFHPRKEKAVTRDEAR